MRIKIIIILLCLVLFTGCSNLVNTETKQLNNTENFKTYDLVISNLKTNNGEIELKVGPLNDTKDNFNGVVVSYNNIDKLYDWQSSTNETYKPIIYFEDLNNDSINEIIINTTLGYGTGLNINEIHILNSKDLNEYKVENINNYIKKYIKTKIDDTLTISIKDKTQQINIDKFKNKGSLYTEAYLGNYITYEVINSKINAIVAVQISDTDFLGTLVFEYDFVDNGFDITNTKSQPISDNSSVLNIIAPAALKVGGTRDITDASMNNRFIYLKVPSECKVKLNAIETYYPSAIITDSTNPESESFEDLCIKILQNLNINTSDTNLKIQTDSWKVCAHSTSNPTQYYCILKSDFPNSNGNIIDYMIFLDIYVESPDNINDEILQDKILKTLRLKELSYPTRNVFVELSNNSEQCRILEEYSVEYQQSLIGQYTKPYVNMEIPSMFIPGISDSSTEYSYGQLNDKLTLSVNTNTKKLENTVNTCVTDSGMSYTYNTEEYLSASDAEVVKINVRIQVSENQSLHITMELYKADFDNLNIISFLNSIEYHQ